MIYAIFFSNIIFKMLKYIRYLKKIYFDVDDKLLDFESYFKTLLIFEK